MDRRVLLDDYGKSLDRLAEALIRENASDLEKAGCIQYFEFCFELAWKSVKVTAESMGIHDCQSPRSSLKQAFANRWIDSEEPWLEMLAARNTMSHTYSAPSALAIHGRLRSFLPHLRTLHARLAAQE